MVGWSESMTPLWKSIKCYRQQKTSRTSRKTAPRTSHRLLRCQVVFIKICFYYYCTYCYCHYCHYYYCHNLNFWVLSQLDFFTFVTIWVFEFCHNLSFQVLWHFLFYSFLTIWVYEFSHNLIFFLVLSQLESLNFVTIWFF